MATLKDDASRSPFEMLTPAEAAKLLKVTERTLYNWLRKGALPALKIGGTWRINASALSELVTKQTRERADQARKAQDK